ncbi:LacI family DNA-binding transcriptional regulator [Pelagimonas varians]|uniref:Maltose regulon regulatory protein MalI n=1 Tax=Pelagimonas varians TaxID=696760 RepID=A0A238KSV7_9RHOB|nr:LacI family DNA-binding transcriptional regulator [Pelagimonas varians]PYG32551.1 LacI family transcriptional regulator [Pelagimonas varians]SMX45909.1 Maltose regulon regulatory protein MalI [Pelagimonas varians]
MSGKPTLGTVAKEAGVSIPTVSQVLRGTGRISEKTRDRVLKAAKTLHYVPDQKAAAMRSGENREIGFVINQLSNPFNAEVISGVVDLLEAEGYLVSILDTRDDSDRQSRQLEAFIRHGRGGLIWVPAVETPNETFDLLAAHKLPTVTFLRNMRKDLDHVGIRNAEATATATRHLLELGHRKIAYLGGTDMTLVRRDRIAGYQKTLSEGGMGAGIIWDSEDNRLAGLEAMLSLHRTHPEVTAVVCNGDMVALGACLALQRTGLVPGKDVSVTGFDNIQDAAVATPPLTTMAVSPHKLGRKLAQVLLDRIRDPDAPISVSEISAELIVRDTTGTP